MREILPRLGTLVIAALLVFATLGWEGHSPRAMPVDAAPFFGYARIISQTIQGEIAPGQSLFFLTVNLVGNVAVFIPLGFCLYLSLPSSPRRLVLATLVGGVFSLTLELGQLALPGRTTAIDDVVLNTLGVAIGGCIAVLCARWQQRRQHGRKSA
jgi:glycopeptide antibiotics resistance protein